MSGPQFGGGGVVSLEAGDHLIFIIKLRHLQRETMPELNDHFQLALSGLHFILSDPGLILTGKANCTDSPNQSTHPLSMPYSQRLSRGGRSESRRAETRSLCERRSWVEEAPWHEDPASPDEDENNSRWALEIFKRDPQQRRKTRKNCTLRERE